VPLGIFTILSIILSLVAIRVLVSTVRDRKQLFDRNFTPQDRQRLSEAAFFLLMPISVLLHEAGHAVTVLAFGGQVVGFGFFLYYGYVQYQGSFTPSQIFWIAFSGNLVSIVLGLLAIAVPLLKRLSPPVTYMLFIFGAIDLANSLVFYPALDFFAQLEGDWSQIYSGNTPLLSLSVAIVQGVLIIGGLIAWRSAWGQRIYAQRTGLSENAVRRITKTQAAKELLEAGERLSSTWKHPLRVVAEAPDGAAGITLHWISGGYGRVVGAFAVVDGHRHVELHGAIHALGSTAEGFQQSIGLIEGIPPPEQLTPYLTKALDLVESWETTTATTS
jgi:Zn-dependent protease